MSTQESGPSNYSVSSSSRQRPPNQHSESACSAPQRSMPLHHRRASGSALTLQTQFTKHHLAGHSITQEYPSNLRFSYMLNSALGSPYLTSTDVQTSSHFNLGNSDGEGSELHRPRPPSPASTAEYSIIDAEDLGGDDAPTIHIPGSYPYAHRRSVSSSFAGFGLKSLVPWMSANGCTSSGFGGASSLSLNHPTESISLPNMNQHSNPFRALLPRIWDALSFPGKALFNNYSTSSSSTTSSVSINPSPAGSPTIFSQSISLPAQLFSSQSPSGRQSPFLWNNHGRLNKGKDRAQPFTHPSEFTEDADWSELAPLDGEEGELIDEACFVDVRVVTGVDIVRLLPPELAVYILQLVATPPIHHDGYFMTGAGQLDPLSNKIEEESNIALCAILSCLAVSHTWRCLASDNSVWQALFLGRWTINLRRADLTHMRKLEENLSVISPSRQLKRHRWKLIPKAQALRFAASLKYGTSANTCRHPSLLVLHIAPKGLCHPKHKFPLQFDWKKLYMDRLELEKRWLGKSYAQIPILLPKDPQRARDTGRSMYSRGGMRSRSLSPARLLRIGSNAPHSTASGPVVYLPDSAALERASGRVIPASQTEPVSMNVLYRSERREPEARELRGHTDRYADVVYPFLISYKADFFLQASTVSSSIPNESLPAHAIGPSWPGV